MTKAAQQNFPRQIQALINLLDSHDGDAAMVKLNELNVEVEKALSELEAFHSPAAENLDAPLTQPDLSLRLLSARLQAAKSEINHTHFMQAKERLQAALHAQLTGEELNESSTA
jgi:hypothetical protein